MYKTWNKIRDKFTFIFNFLTNKEAHKLNADKMITYVMGQEKKKIDSLNTDLLSFPDDNDLDEDGNNIVYKYHCFHGEII